MNRYLHIKVFSFVPKVDLTFRIGHMSENISYYGLLQPIRYKHKYNANIRIRIGFWVANIRIQFFVFVSALVFSYCWKYILQYSLLEQTPIRPI